MDFLLFPLEAMSFTAVTDVVAPGAHKRSRTASALFERLLHDTAGITFRFDGTPPAVRDPPPPGVDASAWYVVCARRRRRFPPRGVACV